MSTVTWLSGVSDICDAGEHAGALSWDERLSEHRGYLASVGIRDALQYAVAQVGVRITHVSRGCECGKYILPA